MPMLLHVALWEPEIPPNTGNIARLCAATGCPLHLIGRLGFRIDDSAVRRAGLDYWNDVEIHQHAALAEFQQWMRERDGTIHCLTSHAEKHYTKIPYKTGDALLFGAETRGLPTEIMQGQREHCYTIPMPAGKVRCLNLSTAAGVVLYDGLRQLHGW